MPYQYQIISNLLLQVEKLVARSADGRVDKYCCVFLPDGTASLTPARPGVTIRNMLTGLCEKRGLPLKDIIIYLHGKDKVRSVKHLHVHYQSEYGHFVSHELKNLFI